MHYHGNDHTHIPIVYVHFDAPSYTTAMECMRAMFDMLPYGHHETCGVEDGKGWQAPLLPVHSVVDVGINIVDEIRHIHR